MEEGAPSGHGRRGRPPAGAVLPEGLALCCAQGRGREAGPWQGGPGPHPECRRAGRREAGSSPPQQSDGGKSSRCLMKFAE